MSTLQTITSPDHPATDQLCAELSAAADDLDASGGWAKRQLALCGEYGVYQWFLPEQWGGQGWDGVDIVRGYLRLSAACLTTTFIITQRTGACRRIASSRNQPLKEALLPALASGERFATLGISHLTTSRRHLAKPVLAVREADGGFVLDGFSPWVTGGPHADHVVIGGTMEDERQILAVLPTDSPGVEAGEPARLVGVSSSHTGPLHCREVFLDRRWLLAGPAKDIMKKGTGAATGGLQTSTLAIGLADAAVRFLEGEAERRADLADATRNLRRDQQHMQDNLLALAGGDPVCSLEDFRAGANSLVLRATQAALTAAKGSGYAQGHPAGRWCREALFFLVWSCPQPVMAANLCELAGLSD